MGRCAKEGDSGDSRWRFLFVAGGAFESRTVATVKECGAGECETAAWTEEGGASEREVSKRGIDEEEEGMPANMEMKEIVSKEKRSCKEK